MVILKINMVIDMPDNIHKALDIMFNKYYGWKARSNSIFCTGLRSDASEYGERVYLIFPVGKYKYLYNPYIPDLYIELNNGNIDNEFEEWYRNEHSTDIYSEWEEEFGVGTGNGNWVYYDSNYGDEIILDGDNFDDEYDVVRYLDVPENAEMEGMNGEYFERNAPYDLDIDVDQVEWRPAISYEDFVIDYEPDTSDPGMDVDTLVDYFEDTFPIKEYETSDIHSALRDSVEIMIHAKEYIGIRADLFEEVLSLYYKNNGLKKPYNVTIKDWYMKHNGRLPKQLTLFK